MSAAVNQIDGHTLTRITKSIAVTSIHKANARQALTGGMQRISLTARVLVKQMPALQGHFKMPKRTNDQATLVAARKFAADVEPLTSEFIAHGMAATFVADFNTRIAVRRN